LSLSYWSRRTILDDHCSLLRQKQPNIQSNRLLHQVKKHVPPPPPHHNPKKWKGKWNFSLCSLSFSIEDS
jgi:hypothetical protein